MSIHFFFGLTTNGKVSHKPCHVLDFNNKSTRLYVVAKKDCLKRQQMDNERLLFIKNLKLGRQKIFVNNDTLALDLNGLFEFLETNHTLVPIAAGNEGKVFKFGRPDHGFSFVVKVIENAKQTESTEAFFMKWLSTEVAEKGKSTAFPFFIASHKNMIAIEFIDYLGLYPHYLFQNLISATELLHAQNAFRGEKALMKASDVTPETRDLYIKSIFIQILHGLYLIQGVNLHGFRHHDLHGRNVMIRKRTQTKPLVLTYFSSAQLMDIVLPDFGIEAVISDYGTSTYPGIGERGQFLNPLEEIAADGIYNDVKEFLGRWTDTFEILKWDSLATQTSNLLLRFKRTPWKFPGFEDILDTEMFKNVFTVSESRKDPKELYISLPPETKRFAETHKIANAWLTDTMPLELHTLRRKYNSPMDIDFFIRRMELYLKIPNNLTFLMKRPNGVTSLIHRLPTMDVPQGAYEISRQFALDDFSESDLDEILEVLDYFDLGIVKFLVAFAIKNNVLR